MKERKGNIRGKVVPFLWPEIQRSPVSKVTQYVRVLQRSIINRMSQKNVYIHFK